MKHTCTGLLHGICTVLTFATIIITQHQALEQHVDEGLEVQHVLFVCICDGHGSYTAERYHHNLRRRISELCSRSEERMQSIQHSMHGLATQHFAAFVSAYQLNSCTRCACSHTAIRVREVMHNAVLQRIHHTRCNQHLLMCIILGRYLDSTVSMIHRQQTHAIAT